MSKPNIIDVFTARENREEPVRLSLCSTCAFARERSPGALLECRRYPPPLHPGVSDLRTDVWSVWPRVGHADWCGEHKLK